MVAEVSNDITSILDLDELLKKVAALIQERLVSRMCTFLPYILTGGKSFMKQAVAPQRFAQRLCDQPG